MAEEQEEHVNDANSAINGDQSGAADILQAGFDYLQQLQNTDAASAPPNLVLPFFLSHVNVTVIDPTVSSISTSNPDNLFDKFASVFETLHGSCLTNVHYQLFRNNAKGNIQRLPIKLNVARSHGGGLLLDENSTSIQDYVWERPYCYLYLAACNSFEHYRTKVKPSIQAFVSQLEASIRTTVRRQSSGNNIVETTKSKKKHTPAPRYVILYIPTGERKPDENSPKKGFGSRLRQRMAAARGVEEGGTGGDGTTDTAEESPDLFNMKLSKVERDILRRFNADFPNGHVCTLCTLHDVAAEMTEETSEKGDSLQKIEWGAVQAAMGQAISFGFKDRCYRFDEELRRLDLQRRGDAKPDETSAMAEGLHLVNFFLVKESLAFTYEQMRLPNEALLQYEELRAFLPDPENDTSMKTCDSWNGTMTDEMVRIAHSGDVLEFRELLRSGDELDAFSNIAQEYLFFRELALLFQMQKSVRITRQCLSYVKTKFRTRRQLVQESSNAQQQLGHVQRRAFEFCWEFRIACDQFLSSKPQPLFSRGVSDILHFARLRLLELGGAHLGKAINFRPKNNPVGNGETWSPWKELPAAKDLAEEGVNASALSPTFLDKALSAPETFDSCYLDLTELIAKSNELCGRHRLASNSRIERMEMFDERGEKQRAASEILSILGVFERDMWSECQFALLFRLASLQRVSSTPPVYLATLIRCFGESVSHVSPKEAVTALYTDLLAVLGNSSVEGHSFSSPPLFKPIFGLEGIKSKRSQGTDRNLVKRLYTVGDTVSVNVSLASYLPEAIDVECVSVELVPFRKYVAAMEDNVPIVEADVCKILRTSGVSSLQPGENSLTFEWLPKSSGQFIISSTTMSCRGVQFVYTAKDLRRPTIRVDIVPCEPTQSLEASPSYILPGHDQQVTLKFSSGSDFVLNGKVSMEGPQGATFLPTGSDEESWVPSCEVELPPCPPAGTVSFTFTVKAPFPREAESAVVATVSSSYKHGGSSDDKLEEDPMEIQLKAKIPLLKEPAVSVVDCDIFPHSVETGLINATVKCNCPVPLSIKDWVLDVPKNMNILDAGDFNASLRNERLSQGDDISFCFEYAATDKLSSLAGLSLRLSMENEQGTVIKESLPLAIAPPLDSKAKYVDDIVVPVTLALSKSEAFVGSILELEYAVDIAAIEKKFSSLVYTIGCEETDWIVSGDIDGVVATTGGSTKVVKLIALPSRPGKLSSFPELSLKCYGDSGMRPLRLDIRYPPPFRSLPAEGHASIAFPTGMSRRAPPSRAMV